MKKILIVATSAYMINQFEKSNIEILKKMGFQVEIAVNFSESVNPMSSSAIESFKQYLIESQIKFYNISFLNKPLAIKNHIKSYYELKKIMKKEKYVLCHVHTPFAAAIARVCAFKCKIPRIVYTAHGFHFFKGAPLKNWIIYYPIEKLLSRITDQLIVINNEDLNLAKAKFKCESINKINGVGISLENIRRYIDSKSELRLRMNINSTDIVLVSVGELNINKNHKVIIDALSNIDFKGYRFFIVGQGKQEAFLRSYVEKKGMEGVVSFLGYQDRVETVLPIADIFCFPSRREGLGLAAIEAMACGIPLLTSNVGGINDYLEDGITGFKFSPDDIEGFKNGILTLSDPKIRRKISKNNLEKSKKYDKKNIDVSMKAIYQKLLYQYRR